jgi:quercetin dioxygenase-like cupin family protein
MDAMIYSAETSPVIFDQDGVLGHSLGTFGDLEYIQLKLSPGAEVPRHALPFAIDFFVVEGRGVALLGDREVDVDTQQLIRVAAGEPRGWRNDAKDDLVLLGIKHVNG